MSHAAVYQDCPWVTAVIHVHHLGLWKALLHQVPTTDKNAPYGSPEMVAAIHKLMRETALKEQQIFVMEGHEEGIFSLGRSLKEAFEVLLRFYQLFVGGQ